MNVNCMVEKMAAATLEYIEWYVKEVMSRLDFDDIDGVVRVSLDDMYCNVVITDEEDEYIGYHEDEVWERVAREVERLSEWEADARSKTFSNEDVAEELRVDYIAGMEWQAELWSDYYRMCC